MRSAYNVFVCKYVNEIDFVDQLPYIQHYVQFLFDKKDDATIVAAAVAIVGVIQRFFCCPFSQRTIFFGVAIVSLN